MRKIICLISLFFVLSACSPSVPEAEYIISQEKNKSLEEQLSVLQSEKDKLESELEIADAELSNLKTELAITTNDLSDAEDEIIALVDDKTELNSHLNELSAQTDELQTSNDELNNRITALAGEKQKLTRELGSYKCDESIHGMQYDSVINASEILAGWMARRSSVERVQGTYRDQIWSNTDTKIHSVRYIDASDGQPYVEHFLVFFNEFGWDEGVFWLSGQCWLDE